MIKVHMNDYFNGHITLEEIFSNWFARKTVLYGNKKKKKKKRKKNALWFAKGRANETCFNTSFCHSSRLLLIFDNDVIKSISTSMFWNLDMTIRVDVSCD